MAGRYPAALIGGAAGALTLTVLHQIVKRVTPKAPRADKLAKEAMRKTIQAAGATPPAEDKLQVAALAGDIAANTAYYSVALAFGPGPAKWLGPLLGASAGAGSITLPGMLGLNAGATNRTDTTKILSFGIYLAGGLAATAVYRALTKPNGELDVDLA